MNHASAVPCAIVGTYEQLEPAGAICYQDKQVGLFACCPCGCGEIMHLPFKGADGRGWTWDGDVPYPTLAPSIRRPSGCKWHGHLISGTWQPSGDSGR